MSGRAARRLLKERDERRRQKVVLSSESDEEPVPKSLFAGLTVEELPDEIEADLPFIVEAAPKKKPKPVVEDDYEALLELAASEPPAAAPIVDETPAVSDGLVFSTKHEYLDVERELQARFGADVIQDRRQIRGPRLLIRPNPGWPRFETPGIKLESIGDRNFHIQHTTRFQGMQHELFEALETGDYGLVASVHLTYRWHPDTLLVLSRVVEQGGDREQAFDLATRALFVYLTAIDRAFVWTGAHPCRLPYIYAENRAVHLTIFRYIQLLVARGCWRTALEWSKRLYSLDPTDPLCVLAGIDTIALRNGDEGALWLLSLIEYLGPARTRSLPSLDFGRALALWRLSRDGAVEAFCEAIFRYPSLARVLKNPRGVGSTKDIRPIAARFYAEQIGISAWMDNDASAWAQSLLDAPAFEYNVEPATLLTPNQRDAVYRRIIVSEIHGLMAALPPWVRAQTVLHDPLPPANGIRPAYDIQEVALASRIATIDPSVNPIVGLLRSFAPWMNEVHDNEPVAEETTDTDSIVQMED